MGATLNVKVRNIYTIVDSDGYITFQTTKLQNARQQLVSSSVLYVSKYSRTEDFDLSKARRVELMSDCV